MRSGVNKLCRSAAPNGPVRHALLVQARRDDDVVEDSRLTLERPERATLRQPRRDLVELVPAFQAAVGLDHGLEQIAHHRALIRTRPAVG